MPRRIVTGIFINNQSLAIPLDIMAKEKLVLLKFENVSLLAGYAGNNIHYYLNPSRLKFEYMTEETIKDENGIIFDLITGNALDLSTKLIKIESKTMYRFAWDNFFPNSHFYFGDANDPVMTSSTLPFLGVIEFLIGLACVGSVLRRKGN